MCSPIMRVLSLRKALLGMCTYEQLTVGFPNLVRYCHSIFTHLCAMGWDRFPNNHCLGEGWCGGGGGGGVGDPIFYIVFLLLSVYQHILDDGRHSLHLRIAEETCIGGRAFQFLVGGRQQMGVGKHNIFAWGYYVICLGGGGGLLLGGGRGQDGGGHHALGY